jgi:hypothetical protein
VLLHRDTPESLAEACQKLTNAFHQGDFIRETEITWQLWLRSLPIVGDRLIDDGRKTDVSHQRSSWADARGLPSHHRQEGLS